MDLGLFEISKGPSKGGGLDLGLLGKSKGPSKGGGLDLGLLGKSKGPSKGFQNAPPAAPNLSKSPARFARQYFILAIICHEMYYLRTLSIDKWLAYPPRLAVELGSCVGGEAHGWAWKPYGWFDPAPRPRDIIHTYIYGRRPRLAHPVRGLK